jgi:hypothetical protein
VLQDILEVLHSAVEFPAVDGLRSLAGVLEGDAEVAAASPGGLLVGDGNSGVANLIVSWSVSERGGNRCRRVQKSRAIEWAGRRAGEPHTILSCGRG